MWKALPLSIFVKAVICFSQLKRRSFEYKQATQISIFVCSLYASVKVWSMEIAGKKKHKQYRGTKSE